MPEGLKVHHDAIEDYFVHMECSVPKLAHYAGYIIANNTLPWAGQVTGQITGQTIPRPPRSLLRQRIIWDSYYYNRKPPSGRIPEGGKSYQI